VSLTDVTFPDPNDQSSGNDDHVPDAASLIQRVVFTFSGPISANEVSQNGLQVRDSTTRELVSGDFTVNGAEVTFYPALPTRPIVELSPGVWDNGGAGLNPDTIYEVTVPFNSSASLPSLSLIEPSLFAKYDSEVLLKVGTIGRNYPPGTREGSFSVLFHTTRREGGFLTGYEPVVPHIVSVAPETGGQGLSPKLFTDPDNRFPAFTPYRVDFDAPLDPSADNVGDSTIKLIDVRDENGQSAGNIQLGVLLTILENRVDGCSVRVVPSGILPLGHSLDLRVARSIRQISGGSTGEKGDSTEASFTIATGGSGRINDVFVEDFQTTHRQDTLLGTDDVLADWDRNNSKLLSSAFGFHGGGELGPFLPVPNNIGTKIIVLDTNLQTFPLFDGSTPGAKPDQVVTDGVFNFTDIVIPDRVVVKGAGTNPLVLTATGSVMIAGIIDVSGINGNNENSYDSAITPTPGGLGGPGGGRGGVSHPTIVDINADANGDGKPDGFTMLNFLPPRQGERGEGPVIKNGLVSFERNGGSGGMCGILRSPKLDCNASQNPGNDNGSRGAGAGGGSFFLVGVKGQDGLGNTASLEKFDSNHNPMYEKVGTINGGDPGDAVFVDSDPLNDFIGQKGELSVAIGGQGGGGGGSRLDSYFCGIQNFPDTVTDSKGGGGGGGGGALIVRALGTITLKAVTGQILATGGWGGIGEQIACGNWGGGGGGGSGGLAILDSATMVVLDDTNDDGDKDCDETSCDVTCDIDISVVGGYGGYPVQSTNVVNDCKACPIDDGNPRGHIKTAPGAGGDGGVGLVQLMVPAGLTPQIGANIFIKPDLGPGQSAVKFPPSEITPISVAQTTWIDVGRVITRSNTSPTWVFRGTDPQTGYVVTDPSGDIPNPDQNTIRVDMLPVVDPVTGTIIEPGKGNFIPQDNSVKVEFQAGDADVPGSKDVGAVTDWSPIIDIANGHQFVRYRVTFNIADVNKNPSAQLSPDSRLSAVRFIKLPFDF
jgi:hypothetical protein